MNDTRDNIIEDVLVDSELAKKLVPNKFKFTSKQGRVRRQKLLLAARKLSESRPINKISLADVCSEAGIPRASAYHFFPNVEAIFLALRFLNAIEILEELDEVKVSDYNRWQGYIIAIMDKSIQVFNSDPTKARLIYETNTPDFEGEQYGARIDGQIIDLIYKKLDAHYDIPNFNNIREIFLVTFAIVNGVFALSFRRHGRITDDMINEVGIATVAYLRCYLPEKLPLKMSGTESK